ncbi:HHR120Wp [Eremothecium sinecaudum]|uniref:HHR120Wp n=1 Tax=Eremothecium sinecaudum TaxID=45286 RepID=A0A0X8HWP1_9SACH|nr:HHR120Wp [Eremothecium sinecaudum]AMD22889.1 HHR120Wp [Eremothecium sinecaudum]
MFKRHLIRYWLLRRYSTNSPDSNSALSLAKNLQQRIEDIPIERYRNFSIVAHVDHGKSTLSDRLLELTGVVKPGGKQVLDKLEVERERGITVKAQTCSMFYKDKRDGLTYLLHLVDTPGHVDFRAEVSRSYASCGGALLLVDASQGVQAQTVANFYLAYSMDLKLIPVINKIDLDVANIPQAEMQVTDMFELPKEDIIKVSAKTGVNIENDLLPAIIDKIPPPTGKLDKNFRALLVDSWYDSYLGVVLLVHCVDGSVTKGDKITSVHTGRKYEVKEVGIMYPDQVPTGSLKSGQVGYLVPGLKESKHAKIGDTLVRNGFESQTEALPGFEETKPMVFVGAFPADGAEFKALDYDIQKLVLNDRAVSLERETSNALGQGWRLGFLGSLHASVFKERLEKEYGSKLIITHPNVPYLIVYKDGEKKVIKNPDDFPDSSACRGNIESMQEPYVEAIMTLPEVYLGKVITLCDDNRGIQKGITYLTTGQVMLKYHLPLAHLVDDFFGKLKSVSRGYASLDYEDIGYLPSKIVKLELLLNGKGVDALAQVMHCSQTDRVGKEWVKRFKQYVKSQLYDVIIQARANNKIIARETIKATGKDVLAKLHASDISRRKKLLSKQKKGKKQLKSFGKVSVDQEAYQAFLRK